MLPTGHPLHKSVASRRTSKVKRHKSPLNILLARYGYDTRNFEKIPATTVSPTQRGKIPFEIDIAANREASTKGAEDAEEEIQVFTDGSAMNGKVGAAALLVRAGKPTKVLHKHLGPDSEHTVHEAELVGLLLGMHLISTENQSSTTCAIGADNQAALKAFHTNRRSPGHHLAREILRIAEQVRKRRSKSKYKLVIRWTAGHEGIEGNEEADREAKKAAEGTNSERRALPAYLRKPLPINPAAVKRAYHDTLKKEWDESWRKSTRGRRIGRIAGETPSKKFLGAISQGELSREMASRIAQFRIGHAPVNQYLKRVGRIDSARCPACGADEETIEHFLLLCPSYAYERWALGMQARKLGKQLTLKTVLGERSMAIPLANYVDATHRFKADGERGERGS